MGKFDNVSAEERVAIIDIFFKEVRKGLVDVCNAGSIKMDPGFLNNTAMTAAYRIVDEGEDPHEATKFAIGLVLLRAYETGQNPMEKKSTCFPADTRVLTIDGYRKISEVNVGDSVIAMSRSRSQCIATVKKVFAHGPNIITTLSFSDGAPLRATSNHTIWTAKGWRTISQLKQGDEVVDSFGSTRTVDSITKSPPEPVHHLHCDGEQNFVVEGCIAHNFTNFRGVRTWWHKMFVDQPPALFHAARKGLMGNSRVALHLFVLLLATNLFMTPGAFMRSFLPTANAVQPSIPRMASRTFSGFSANALDVTAKPRGTASNGFVGLNTGSVVQRFEWKDVSWALTKDLATRAARSTIDGFALEGIVTKFELVDTKTGGRPGFSVVATAEAGALTMHMRLDALKCGGKLVSFTTASSSSQVTTAVHTKTKNTLSCNR